MESEGGGNFKTKKIFVGGLPPTLTEDGFRQYFESYGHVTDVVVTQRPRGFGFITFDSEDAVDRVLHMTFHELMGKRVEVKPALPKYANSGGGSRQGYGSSSDQQQQTGGRKTILKVSVVAEEDEQIGEEWFLHDHQKCIDCLSVLPPDFEEQCKCNDFFNRSPSSSDVEPEEFADLQPKEMPYCDWLLEEKDHRMRLDDSERMVMELTLEMEAEMADRRRMKLEAEMADLENQPPWKDEEPNWSPINFMLKEDLSP